MIKSVDGKEDTKSIVNFVNNKFLTRDTKAFREHIKELQPDMKMEFEYDNPNRREGDDSYSNGSRVLPFLKLLFNFTSTNF